ncbi:MAG: hypothetical protein HQL38_08410, partial [Alphaproteobacteria bacterium]|nr:hypothetical protein [Alphaproteobacteria bacterium]
MLNDFLGTAALQQTTFGAADPNVVDAITAALRDKDRPLSRVEIHNAVAWMCGHRTTNRIITEMIATGALWV